MYYSPVPINRGGGGGPNKKGGLKDNLNINKRGGGGGVPNKRRGLENVLGQKWQPVMGVPNNYL